MSADEYTLPKDSVAASKLPSVTVPDLGDIERVGFEIRSKMRIKPIRKVAQGKS